MTADVRRSYDAMAERYAALFVGDLDHDPNGREWLATFARLAAGRAGVVADLGCGPGHVVDLLSRLGLTTVGYDISAGQIAEARRAFPAAEFHIGDFAALDVADAAFGGIVSRYSIIHTPPNRIVGVLTEWLRVLEPGAPMLLSFFGSTTSATHGTPFDHKVVTAYELCPDIVARELESVGFTDIEIGVLPPPEGGRPFDQATILAAKPTVTTPPG